MDKNRKTSHILNVFQYDVDGHVVLPASLTLTVAPASGDNSGKVGTTAWVRSYVTGLNYLTAGSTSTSDIAEGTNLYYTNSRFDTRLATKSTTDLAEGTGLYFTTARARAAISVTGSGSYDSATGVITVTGGVTAVNTKIGDVTLTTSDITEGTRLYYTDTRVGTYLTSNSYATQSYVATQIANLVDSAPGTLDTLNELAAALGDDPNFATSVATSIGTKQAQLNGTGFVKISGTTISYDNSTYLTSFTETDPIYVASSWYSTTNNASNWNTAYGWGNHASAGYLTTSSAASTYLTQSSASTLYLSIGNAATTYLSQSNASLSYVSLSGSYANPSWITSLAYSKLTGVPSTFTPSSHTHAISEVTGLQTALDGKQASGSYAAASHSHSISDVTGLQTALDGKQATLSSTPSFDQVITSNNGNGTNFRIGDDVWIGDINVANTFRIQGLQDSTQGYIVFGNSNATALGRTGTGGLTYGGNVILHAGNYSSYSVPTTRTLTINGTAYDLSADRSWTITASETDTLATVMARGASTASGITFTAPGGTVLLKHAVSEVDAWIFQENAANWGLYWKNAPSGHHTFGGYTTVGAELFGMSAANASGNGVTTSNFVGATSAIAQWMISNYTGYIWSASTIYAVGTMYSAAYRGNANVAGTGEAVYAPAGVYSTGNNWLYGTMYLNGNTVNDASYLGIIGANNTPINITGAAHKYVTINPGNGYEAMVRYLGGSGSSWYVGKRTASQLVGTESFHFYSEAAGATVGGVDTGGNIFASGSMRAPIFYDSNDTGYYADFNTTSDTGIRLRGGILMGPNPTWGAYLQVGGNGNNTDYATVVATDGNLHIDSQVNKALYLNYYHNGTIYLNGTTYSISSNGSYYNGTSAYSNNSGALNGWGYTAYAYRSSGTSGYYQVNDWMQFNGNYGIYWPGYYGLHFYPNNDGSYGSAQILGDKGGWRGLHFGGGNGMTLMMNETEFGFHRQAIGWYARFTNGRFYGACDNVYNLDYALGNTHYWTAINYFQTNNGGQAVNNSNSAKLEAYSTGNNSAFMSFHKGGHYAINMGLDDDNVFRIGGWSASGNRLQMDMSGNLTMAGDVTAYSDARVKENIVTVDNALNKVLALRGVYYNRIDSDDKKTKLGVIAQEILQTVPEVVNQDNDGMFNVSYGNLAGLFIEAFKEQQKQIEELKSIIYGLTR